MEREGNNDVVAIARLHANAFIFQNGYEEFERKIIGEKSSGGESREGNVYGDGTNGAPGIFAYG